MVDALSLTIRKEGLIPALESAHAFVQAFKEAPRLSRDDVIVINQSGRGDKDIFTIADAFRDPKWEAFIQLTRRRNTRDRWLETTLREKRREQEILLMTHIVLGYPDFDDCLRVVESMVEAGVDMMELQIPFSEPIADGPVILHANQKSLQAGSTVETAASSVAEGLTRRFDIPFLFMSYYNILFKRGTAEFVRGMRELGMQGAIVPDLPPEEAGEYVDAMRANELAPIWIFSPNTSDARMRMIAEHAEGFVYCVARKGVTGAATDFSKDLAAYLARCRAATDLPLALGFGVKDKADVDFLRGQADIAVIGTQTIRVMEEQGVAAVKGFIAGLR